MAMEDLKHLQQEPQSQSVQQYGQPYYDDPYYLPQDPYLNRPSPNNMNAQVMLALLDSKYTKEVDFNDFLSFVPIIIDNLGRIPNIDRTDVNLLRRDFVDIRELSECDGTEEMCGTMMLQLLFDIRTLVAYGGAELKGLTGISSIITTRQQAEQTVKMPTQAPEQRKKIFGVF